LTLQDIAQQLNPLLRGWIAYYGNQTLVAWAMRKFKRFKRHKVQASQFLQRLATECVDLFIHWQIKMTGVFA
jgi:RNA-directed DNA polymerase